MRLIFTLLFVFYFVIGNSQLYCGTEEPTTHRLPTKEEIKKEILRLKNVDKNDPRVYMVSPFIIRNSAGSNGLYIWQFEQELEKLNEDFAPLNIRFEVCDEIIEILNDDFVILDYDERSALIQNNIEGSINIYFAPQVLNSSGNNICGNATFPSTSKNLRRILMQNNCVGNGSTFTHEMGHYFNLLHTHSTFYGKERVERINCDSTGDGFCDTEADPVLNSEIVSSSCIYTGSAVDDYFVPYDPDPKNFMSYSRKTCRTLFSPEQQATMSLASQGENSYHRMKCDLPDFNVTSISNVLIDKFEDQELNFTIEANSNEEDFTLDYSVNLIHKLTSEKYFLTEGSVNVLANETEVDIPYTISFFNELFEYFDVEIEIDTENAIEEKFENNNIFRQKLVYEFNNNASTLVFPNPATSEVSIFLNSNNRGEGNLQIFSSSGQLVFEETIKKSSSMYFRNIDVDHLIPGIYFIYVAIDSETETLRFLKQ